jgi:ATP/maltotriose-dependent transcriptional regulator MalT
MATTMLAEVALDRGDAEAAARLIERTESLIGDHAGRKRVASLDRLRGLLALDRGDTEAAEAALRDAIDAAQAAGFALVEAKSRAAFGAVAVERGDAEAAAERLTAALDLGYRIESAEVIASTAGRLADALADGDGGRLDREALVAALRESAPEAVGSERATDPAAYRRLAERWRVDGEEVTAPFPCVG